MWTHFICQNSPDQTKDEISLIDALGVMFIDVRDIANLAAEIDRKMDFLRHTHTKRDNALWTT